MKTITAFIKRHLVLTYYALVFAILWGGFLLVGGPGILTGTSWQTDPLFTIAVLAMLAGPPVTGIMLTVLVSGKEGQRELLLRPDNSMHSTALHTAADAERYSLRMWKGLRQVS